MYIINPEILNQDDLYVCEDESLVQSLIDRGFVYLSKEYDDDDYVVAWIFSKTEELVATLKEVS